MPGKILQYPDLDLAKIVGIVGIVNGGTDGDTAPEAVTNLGGVSRSSIGHAGGPVPIKANGEIDITFFDVITGAFVTLTGPATLQSGQPGSYPITNYDSFKTYNLSCLSGSVSRSGNMITYTAPLTGGVAGFNINGRTVEINVIVPTIVQPVVSVANLNTANGSAFSVSINTDTHEGTDWQLATDVNFTNIVQQLVNSASNKLSWPLSGLSAPVTYYVRARYKGTAYGYGEWSTPVSFTTVLTPFVSQPTITSPSNGSTNNSNVPSFTSSAYAPMNGAGTHQSSDWQLSEVNDFSSTVDWIENNTTNKTSWTNLETILKQNTVYYARVRYKSSDGLTSAWSPVISFTVFDSTGITFTVTPNTTTVNEGSNVTFNVAASSIPNGSLLKYNIVVGNPPNFASANDFGNGTDNNSPKGSFVFNNNTASFVITTFNDNVLESNETFYAEILTSTKYRNGVSSTFVDNANVHLEAQSTNVTIVANDQPVYTIVVKDVLNNIITAVQEAATAKFYITTTNVPDGTVLYWSVSGTNIGATEFNPSLLTGSVTINSNAGLVNLTPDNEGVVEGNEAFTFDLKTGSQSGTIVASAGPVTIIDSGASESPWLLGADFDSNFNDPLNLAIGVTLNNNSGNVSAAHVAYSNYPFVSIMTTSGNIPPGTVIGISANDSMDGPPYSVGNYDIVISGTPNQAGSFTATITLTNPMYYSGASFQYIKSFTKTFVVS